MEQQPASSSYQYTSEFQELPDRGRPFLTEEQVNMQNQDLRTPAPTRTAMPIQIQLPNFVAQRAQALDYINTFNRARREHGQRQRTEVDARTTARAFTAVPVTVPTVPVPTTVQTTTPTGEALTQNRQTTSRQGRRSFFSFGRRSSQQQHQGNVQINNHFSA